MKKNSMLILFFIIASLMFSACTMSASTPPPTTPTTNISEIARQATQTAIAKTPKAGEGESQTPEPTTETEAEPTETPEEVTPPTNTPEPEATDDPEPVTEYAVPDSYTLHQGEFPFCLARRFNILPEDLMDYNGLESETTYYPGLTINIPSNARSFIGDRALQYHPSTYTVEYGDTLYSIACLYGDVDPRAIAAVNDLDIDQALTPGTTLQIP